MQLCMNVYFCSYFGFHAKPIVGSKISLLQVIHAAEVGRRIVLMCVQGGLFVFKFHCSIGVIGRLTDHQCTSKLTNTHTHTHTQVERGPEQIK